MAHLRFSEPDPLEWRKFENDTRVDLVGTPGDPFDWMVLGYVFTKDGTHQFRPQTGTWIANSFETQEEAIQALLESEIEAHRVTVERAQRNYELIQRLYTELED